MFSSISSVLNTPARVLVESDGSALKVRLSRGALDLSIVTKKDCLSAVINSAGNPPGPGLWVWGGYVFEGDVVSHGRWRSCTNAELEAISSGLPLWPELPNGDSDDERVLVLPSGNLPSHEGALIEDDGSVYEGMKGLHYDRRGDMEENEDFKQLIPYVVLTSGNLLFVYRRKSKGNEERLHDKLSLGVGGHIDQETVNPSGYDAIFSSAMRELHEEIEFSSIDQWSSIAEDERLKYRGLINDNSDSVGRVHVGILFTADVEGFVDGRSVVGVKETSKMEGRWMTTEQVREQIDRFESWSQIAFESLAQRAASHEDFS